MGVRSRDPLAHPDFANPSYDLSGSPFASKDAELKNLLRAPRGRMFMPHGMDRPERLSECSPQACSVVAHDRQAAAPLRTIERERSDNGVPPDLQTAHEATYVGSPVVFFSLTPMIENSLTVVTFISNAPPIPTMRIPNGPATCLSLYSSAEAALITL